MSQPHRTSELQINILTVINANTKGSPEKYMEMVELKKKVEEERNSFAESVTRSCQTLAERGLIKRLVDLQSLRVSVSLTPEGLKLLAEKG